MPVAGISLRRVCGPYKATLQIPGLGEDAVWRDARNPRQVATCPCQHRGLARTRLVQVLVDLGAGLVQRVDRRAAKLKLAAGLQRHALPVQLRADDAAGLHYRRPAEAAHEPIQQLRHFLVRHAPRGGHVVAQLFILRAEPGARVLLPRCCDRSSGFAQLTGMAGAYIIQLITGNGGCGRPLCRHIPGQRSC